MPLLLGRGRIELLRVDGALELRAAFARRGVVGEIRHRLASRPRAPSCRVARRRRPATSRRVAFGPMSTSRVEAVGACAVTKSLASTRSCTTGNPCSCWRTRRTPGAARPRQLPREVPLRIRGDSRAWRRRNPSRSTPCRLRRRARTPAACACVKRSCRFSICVRIWVGLGLRRACDRRRDRVFSISWQRGGVEPGAAACWSGSCGRPLPSIRRQRARRCTAARGRLPSGRRVERDQPLRGDEVVERHRLS